MIGFMLFSACQECRHDSIFGSRIVIEQTRTVAPFHSVEILGSCDLSFTQAAIQKLRLVGEDNILPLIKTWVKGDGTLVIENTENYRSEIGVKVYVSMPDIRGFYIYGAANVRGEQHFRAEDLNLVIGGSGNINADVEAQKINTSILGSGEVLLSGTAKFHDLKILGSGNVRALDLLTSRTDITLAGSGNCHVYVKNVLSVVLAGSGNVYYRGDPEVVDSYITGSGQLIKLD